MHQLQYITLTQLLASVKGDLPSFKDSGFIDEGNVTKTVMWCNEKLGLPIYKMKETVIPVRNYRAELPKGFQKVIYVAALKHNSFGIAQYRDPFDNFVDQTAECAFDVEQFTEGCVTKCNRTIKRKKADGLWEYYTNWTELTLSPQSYIYTASNCVNRHVAGTYTIELDDEEIRTPFREGELYMMYYGMLEDEEGNVLVPFHPLLTTWYEWCVKEKILMDMAFNSDGDVVNKLKLAQMEKSKAWLDALDYASEPSYKQQQEYQRRKEVDMWNKYFKWIK
jgi:hypothetical protein